jgi:formylglycine-generating enzyme required for sulfatase activity
MNVSKLSLAALRDRIAAGTREVDVVHNSKADGTGTTVVSKMIYVPKFRVPAGIWDGGAFPPQDLLLGGFLIDKYPCSQPDATSESRGSTSANSPGLTAAVSQQGVVPWTDINFDNAKTACANRIINGRACHLVTMKEWATIAFLIKLLGHDIRGNNYWGRDYRDLDSWEYYGIADPVVASYTQQYSPNKQYSRCLTGSGPVSWSHNGMANGVFDIVGNVWEWVDFQIDAGVYEAVKTAAISDADGITATDTAIVLGLGNVEDLEYWPASNGLVYIEETTDGTTVYPAEYIIYGSLVDNGDGTVTLTSCQRGVNGTTAGAHPDGTPVQQINKYCVIPGGYSAKVSGDGLNNTTDPATFDYTDLVLGPGGVSPQVGDILQIENEQLEVTGVSGQTLTVSRGANGSKLVAHADGTAFARISPQMTNSNPTATGIYGAYQYAKFVTLRTEAEVAAMALPATVSSGGNEEWKDGFWIRNYGQRAALRGGDWGNGSNARAGFALHLGLPPSYAYISVGFRAALSL